MTSAAVGAAALDVFPTIETTNLVLRGVTHDDLPALFEVFSHPEVVRYWSAPALPDLHAAEALLASIVAGFRERTLLQWAVTRRGEDRLLGTCTLYRMDTPHRHVEIGYALGRAHWGRGIMREALPAVLRFAFHTLGMHRIQADVDPRNSASARALEALGFRLEGHLRECYFMAGEIQDAHIYGLLRTDAPAVWDAAAAR